MSLPSATPTVSRQHRSTRTAELFAALIGAVGDERDELIEALVLVNRGVAEALASRYRGRGLAPEDLRQVAYEGLTKAVRRFDPALRNDFMSYAVPTIRGELQRHFRDKGWVVRPPRRLQELQGRINVSLDRLTQELSRHPTHAEIADDLRIDAMEYAEAVNAFGSFSLASLDRPASEDSETTVGDLIGSEPTDEITPRMRLEPVMRRLSERDRRIIRLRFFEDKTQAEIGREIGVSQMHVSRVLARILAKLRTDLGEDG